MLICVSLSCNTNNSNRGFSQCMCGDTFNIAWDQAQLSLCRGGPGLWSLARHSSAAFISSICPSGFGSQSVHHLSRAIEVFNSLVSPGEAITAETALLSPPTQNKLSSKLDDYLFNHLLNPSHHPVLQSRCL